MQHILNAPPSPRQQNPLLLPALEEVLLCCLEKEPARRFQDGNALAHRLAKLEERASHSPPSHTTPAAQYHFIQRYPVNASGSVNRAHDPPRNMHSQHKKPRGDGQERIRFSFVVLLAIIAGIAGMVLLMGLSLFYLVIILMASLIQLIILQSSAHGTKRNPGWESRK
jgi:hypothetical protein